MSGKVELHRHLQAAGYQLGAFASKETLTNVLRLHSTVSEPFPLLSHSFPFVHQVQAEKHINVAELSDVELRKTLTKHGLIVGPVTSECTKVALIVNHEFRRLQIKRVLSINVNYSKCSRTSAQKVRKVD